MLEQLVNKVSESISSDKPLLVHCPTSDRECSACMSARLFADKGIFVGFYGLVHCGVAGSLAFAGAAGVGGVWSEFFRLWALFFAAYSAGSVVIALALMGSARYHRDRASLTCQFDRLNRRIGTNKSLLLVSVAALSTMALSTAMVPQ